MQRSPRLLRLREVCARTGRARSSLYRDIDTGVMVPPIQIGARGVGVPEHEVDAIIGARIAGVSDDEIRALVLRLVAERQKGGESESGTSRRAKATAAKNSPVNRAGTR